jgi:inhibitor of the pro-sigma K processing machinery
MVSLRAVLGNAVVGLVALVLANLFGLGVEISAVTLMICGIFGLFGAVLVVVLATYGVAFSALLFPPL